MTLFGHENLFHLNQYIVEKWTQLSSASLPCHLKHNSLAQQILFLCVWIDCVVEVERWMWEGGARAPLGCQRNKNKTKRRRVSRCPRKSVFIIIILYVPMKRMCIRVHFYILTNLTILSIFLSCHPFHLLIIIFMLSLSSRLFLASLAWDRSALFGGWFRDGGRRLPSWSSQN